MSSFVFDGAEYDPMVIGRIWGGGESISGPAVRWLVGGGWR